MGVLTGAGVRICWSGPVSTRPVRNCRSCRRCPPRSPIWPLARGTPRSPTPAPAGSDAVCPYRGLAAYDVADAQYFFGREVLTEQLMVRLAERLVGAGMLMVVGPSGSGKSSLLRAGLIPALEALYQLRGPRRAAGVPRRAEQRRRLDHTGGTRPAGRLLSPVRGRTPAGRGPATQPVHRHPDEQPGAPRRHRRTRGPRRPDGRTRARHADAA